MSEIKRLRGFVEELLFYMENCDHYVGHLTEEGVRRSSQEYITQVVKENVNWHIDFDQYYKEDPANE